MRANSERTQNPSNPRSESASYSSASRTPSRGTRARDGAKVRTFGRHAARARRGGDATRRAASIDSLDMACVATRSGADVGARARDARGRTRRSATAVTRCADAARTTTRATTIARDDDARRDRVEGYATTARDARDARARARDARIGGEGWWIVRGDAREGRADGTRANDDERED